MLHMRNLSLLSRSIARFHTTAIAWAAHKSLKRFNLADIGEGITECEVIKWNVKPANTVQAFDPLCEVQSDKASVEITSPFDGVVKEILVKEGDVAKVGEALCTIEVVEDVEDSNDLTNSESDTPHTSKQDPYLTRNASPSDYLDGTGSGSGSPPQRRPHPLDPNVIPDFAAASVAHHGDVLATPSVRHFARLKGVNIADISPGSGREARVEKKDVEAFLARQTSPETDASSNISARTISDTSIVVELGRTRYSMWKAMEKSLGIPHFGFSTALDLTRLHDLMPILNAHIPTVYSSTRNAPVQSVVSPSSFYEMTGKQPPLPEYARYDRLTYLSILLKTLSKAMLEWPLLRSSLTAPPSNGSSSDKPTLTIRPHCDISVALSTPTGLYTPTIQNVESESIYSLAARLRQLGHLGRQVPCALTPADMPKKGGTISVSNVGGVGQVTSASPVLVPGGGVAIVAIGRAKWVWDVDRNSTGQRRLQVNVSWSADHRIIEGAELVAFVETWRSWVEQPERMIAECI